MTEQGQDAAVELLALMRAQEARRQRRNRVLLWVLVAAVVVGGVVAVVLKVQHDQAVQDQRVREAFCDMTTDYGTPQYYDCIG